MKPTGGGLGGLGVLDVGAALVPALALVSEMPAALPQVPECAGAALVSMPEMVAAVPEVAVGPTPVGGMRVRVVHTYAAARARQQHATVTTEDTMISTDIANIGSEEQQIV